LKHIALSNTVNFVVFDGLSYPVNIYKTGMAQLNPLPSLTLQSAWDLNVPCQPKRSKALLLSYTFKCLLKKNADFLPVQ
jgi:hypothetical protein